MGKKPAVKNRNELVNLITVLTENKNEAGVQATRRFVKRMIEFDAKCTIEGRPSPLVMLRKESRARPEVKKYLATKNKK